MWTSRAGADVNMVPKERELGSALAIAAAFFSNGDGTVDTLVEAGAVRMRISKIPMVDTQVH